MTDIFSTFWIYDLIHVYIALKLCKQPYTSSRGNPKYVNIILHFKDVKYINQSIGDWTYKIDKFKHTYIKKTNLDFRLEI